MKAHLFRKKCYYMKRGPKNQQAIFLPTAVKCLKPQRNHLPLHSRCSACSPLRVFSSRTWPPHTTSLIRSAKMSSIKSDCRYYCSSFDSSFRRATGFWRSSSGDSGSRRTAGDSITGVMPAAARIAGRNQSGVKKRKRAMSRIKWNI